MIVDEANFGGFDKRSPAKKTTDVATPTESSVVVEETKKPDVQDNGCPAGASCPKDHYCTETGEPAFICQVTTQCIIAFANHN